MQRKTTFLKRFTGLRTIKVTPGTNILFLTFRRDQTHFCSGISSHNLSILQHTTNPYGGVTIQPDALPPSTSDFDRMLGNTVKHSKEVEILVI